jgi:hypothetical protein
MPQPNGASALSIAPLWVQPLRWVAYLSITGYYHTAYRIRGWGRLPRRRGASLLLINHQHDIEAAVIVATLGLTSWSWRYPIFAVSSRRMYEQGFLAERIPWLEFALRGARLGWLFSVIGTQPIENELHTRPFAGVVSALLAQHGDLLAADVFREGALARLPARARTLADVLKPANFKAARSNVTLSELREPYRSASLAATRVQLDADTANFERLVRAGATVFLAPEGSYSGDGKMKRLRGILPRLAPLARIWLCGISYDPFVGRRLSMLYRIAASVDGAPLDLQLKALRPVTTSALLAAWLSVTPGPFSIAEAIGAVSAQINALPPDLFVDPELRKNPAALTRSALQGLSRLGILAPNADGFALTASRTHPQFPRTRDIIAYQVNFHEETLQGARSLMSS